MEGFVTEDAIRIVGLEKRFKGFALEIPELSIPKGFTTALIGENGAGKTTLLNILAGVRLDYKGDVTFFGKYSGREEDPYVRNHVGFLGGDNYYMPHWTVEQVRSLNASLFEGFSAEKFDAYCRALDIGGAGGGRKPVRSLSSGNKVKLMLAGVLARDTNLLLLDEPASPLDPLMREALCNMIREYIDAGAGERTVLLSSHNVSDMENVTDYALIMEKGRIVEQGFVTDLKEKYILIKGDPEGADAARKVLMTMSSSSYGYEGLCRAEDLDRLAGLNVETEVPSLTAICVGIMQQYSSLKALQDIARM
ncbi:MAG: ABC transporter ATP-binding protein [Lachnospiraceae bacterium]|nr:ABC transporter ATP-binding protein [Lachnospiraceae bacterium]